MKWSRDWAEATTRPRAEPSSLRAPPTSTSPTAWFQLPPRRVTERWVVRGARLRTKLMVPEGSPTPVIRPVGPRTTSTWSYMAMVS